MDDLTVNLVIQALEDRFRYSEPNSLVYGPISGIQMVDHLKDKTPIGMEFVKSIIGAALRIVIIGGNKENE